MAGDGATIRPLSEVVINQIAAGEVVERPVSVVKELVENSLDAGARRIDVETLAGGIDRIAVTDNGTGIRAADLPGAVRRHWTSKLSALDDLQAIGTLGFRGEALASIASVADFNLVTRADGDDHAWRLDVAAGAEAPLPRPAQGNRGTRIEVNRLFHHIPARKRFLKQPRTEYLHIVRVMRQLAFAQPQVEFSLTQAGSRGLRLPAADYQQLESSRWRSVFGKQFCEHARTISFNDGHISVHGWVGTPDCATNLSDTQFIVLNGRAVRDKQLQHAVRLAYADQIAEGRFPSFAIALELSPDTIDVNVHPGKLEVRLANMRQLHDLLFVAVKQALESGALFPAEEQAVVDAVPPLPSIRTRPHAVREVSRGRVPAVKAATSGRFNRPVRLIDSILLFEDDGGLCAIDLVRAWTEVLAARLRMECESGTAATRPLLLPVRLASDNPLAASEHRATLATMGVEVDELGESTSLLRSLPAVAPECDADRFAAALTAAITRVAPTEVVVAEALAHAIAHGRTGQVDRARLNELEQSATAACYALGALVRQVDEAALAEWLAGE